MTLRRLILSRVTILTTIVLALLAMLVGSFIPQAFMLTPSGLLKWRADYPNLAPLAEKLGLTHVYTHPLFALILLAAVITLGFSCYEQLRRTLRLWRDGSGCEAGRQFMGAGSLTEAGAILRSHGYRQKGERFVRHVLGFWGNTLLHTGMLVVITASLWIALFQQRGMVRLAEGDLFKPGDPWLSSEQGLLAGSFALDDAVRLDRVAYDYWPSHAVKRVASQLAFISRDGTVTDRPVAINSVMLHQGVRVYQGIDFGHAFFVEIRSADGRTSVSQLFIEHQQSPEKAGYADFENFFGPGKTLRVKYFAEVDHSSLQGTNPLLVMRLDEGGREIGQISLTTGATADLAGYRARLVAVRRWSSFIFVNLTGISAIFAGFGIICLGGVLNYFTSPREAWVRETAGGGTEISWHANRFARFYEEEYEELKREMSAKEQYG